MWISCDSGDFDVRRDKRLEKQDEIVALAFPTTYSIREYFFPVAVAKRDP